MSVHNRDFIFKFENSCNCRCMPKFSCFGRRLQGDDPVYVSPKGNVSKFDFNKGAEVGSVKTLANIESILQTMAKDHYKMKAIVIEVERQMNISLDKKEPRIINASQLKRIETIAKPIILSRRIAHEDSRSISYVRPPNPSPESPKPVQLVKSPAMRDIRLERIEVMDEKSPDPFVMVD